VQLHVKEFLPPREALSKVLACPLPGARDWTAV